MLKKMKIKSQVFYLTAIILGIIIILQAFLYSILSKESKSIVNTVFDSITQSTCTQIDKLNASIAESTSLFAVHRSVQTFIYEYSHAETVRNFSEMQSSLNDFLNNNRNVSFLGLIKNRKLFMSAENVSLYDEVRNIISEIPTVEDSIPMFYPSFTHEGETYFACVTPIFPTNPLYYSPEHEGNFVICIYQMDSITYSTYSFIDNSRINMIITDKNNNILFSSNPKEHGKPFNFKNKDRGYLFKSLPISNTEWNLSVFMSSDNISVFSGMSLFFIAFMIVVTIGLLVLMFKFLNDIIVKRIMLLDNSVGRISDSDTTYRIKYDFTDELSNVVTTINRVLDKVHSLNKEKISTLDSLYQSRLLQKETQVYYLYNQVSPHFLYNSLSYIQGVAFKYNAEEIVNMTSSLAKVYRYFSTNHTLSTIKQDLDCAIEYFNVINFRKNIPLELNCDIEQELMSVKCLKMIFQPIVENILKHAYEVNDMGTVSIKSIPDKEKAIIEITDDGKGISSEVLEDIEKRLSVKEFDKTQSNEHVGLVNVNMRLKLYYNDDDCGIKIISRYGEGTTVRITFLKEPPISENHE